VLRPELHRLVVQYRRPFGNAQGRLRLAGRAAGNPEEHAHVHHSTWRAPLSFGGGTAGARRSRPLRVSERSACIWTTSLDAVPRPATTTSICRHGRVEVLEGPQGTLFGGGAQAGASGTSRTNPIESRKGPPTRVTVVTAGGDPNSAVNGRPSNRAGRGTPWRSRDNFLRTITRPNR